MTRRPLTLQLIYMPAEDKEVQCQNLGGNQKYHYRINESYTHVLLDSHCTNRKRVRNVWSY